MQFINSSRDTELYSLLKKNILLNLSTMLLLAYCLIRITWERFSTRACLASSLTIKPIIVGFGYLIFVLHRTQRVFHFDSVERREEIRQCLGQTHIHLQVAADLPGCSQRRNKHSLDFTSQILHWCQSSQLISKYMKINNDKVCPDCRMFRL